MQLKGREGNLSSVSDKAAASLRKTPDPQEESICSHHCEKTRRLKGQKISTVGSSLNIQNKTINPGSIANTNWNPTGWQRGIITTFSNPKGKRPSYHPLSNGWGEEATLLGKWHSFPTSSAFPQGNLFCCSPHINVGTAFNMSSSIWS